MKIRLFDHMVRPDGATHADGMGREEGRQTHERLLKITEAHPEAPVFEISLNGVRFVDASFAREAVVSLMKRYRGQHSFCLVDVPSEDVLDNFEAGALRLDQPVVAVAPDGGIRVIGPRPPEGLKQMLQHVLIRGVTSSTEAASALNLGLSNASNKLKALWRDGYVLRREKVAPSGGIEHEYLCPGCRDPLYSV
jgi:hypothetical protein